MTMRIGIASGVRMRTSGIAGGNHLSKVGVNIGSPGVHVLLAETVQVAQ